VAHGFAGSQPLMAAFATAFARNGFIAITFDFPGHGRHPQPLSGSVGREGGTTRALVDETKRVLAFARTLGDGRLALLGHSMASDVVIRAAQEAPDVGATVAVSMFSRTATATSPRNLLVIVGDWEGRLKAEALRVVGLASAPEPPREGATTATWCSAPPGAPRSARASSMSASCSARSPWTRRLRWLDGSFGIPEREARYVDRPRAPGSLLLLAGFVLLAWPLSRLLPVVAHPPAGAGLSWRRLWPLLVGPGRADAVDPARGAHPLPAVLVADYVAAHFALYGLLTALGLLLVRARRSPAAGSPLRGAALAGATLWRPSTPSPGSARSSTPGSPPSCRLRDGRRSFSPCGPARFPSFSPTSG
jgi:pimeloyl-ACP methyl ester carboxylesterase